MERAIGLKLGIHGTLHGKDSDDSFSAEKLIVVVQHFLALERLIWKTYCYSRGLGKMAHGTYFHIPSIQARVLQSYALWNNYLH